MNEIMIFHIGSENGKKRFVIARESQSPDVIASLSRDAGEFIDEVNTLSEFLDGDVQILTDEKLLKACRYAYDAVTDEHVKPNRFRLGALGSSTLQMAEDILRDVIEPTDRKR